MIFLSFICFFYQPADSVGLKQIGDHVFILYQVTEGESFFSISRRYGLKPYQLRAANPEIENLKIGEVILVPTAKTIPKKAGLLSGQIKTHRVELGETLYSLSQLYGVPVEQIRKHNNLIDNILKEGKFLKIGTVRLGPSNVYTLDSIATTHLVEPGETAILISKKYKIPVDLVYRNNNLTESSLLFSGMELIIAPRPVALLQIDADFSYYTPDPLGMPANFDERGTGNLINNNIPKNVALHKAETIGKYIKVFFPGTKRAVMAKVIGEVPDFERKKGIIVKISLHAGASLGIKNREFPVILQYEKP